MTRTTLKTLRSRLPSLAALAAFVAFTLLVAAAGCASTPTSLAGLAGRYELRSVDGRSLPDDRLGGAIAGELVLDADGRATRTVQYATSGIPGPITRRAAGTYRRRGDEITFLPSRQGLPVSEGTREVRGVVRPPTITLRHSDPTDRIVEELYVRVQG